MTFEKLIFAGRSTWRRANLLCVSTYQLSMVQGKGTDVPYRLAAASECGSALAMTDEDGGSRR